MTKQAICGETFTLQLEIAGFDSNDFYPVDAPRYTCMNYGQRGTFFLCSFNRNNKKGLCNAQTFYFSYYCPASSALSSAAGSSAAVCSCASPLSSAAPSAASVSSAACSPSSPLGVSQEAASSAKASVMP